MNFLLQKQTVVINGGQYFSIESFDYILSARKIKRGHTNRSLPRFLVRMFQNESSCKTFHVKMSLIYMKMKL